MVTKKITVEGTIIGIETPSGYICLSDMARKFGDTGLIDSWLRNKNTVEFLGVWERVNNPDFNSVEFDGIMTQAGLNRFRLSAKEWAKRTKGKGLIAKAGRYGGTYAHPDIAFEFGAWLSPEFKLYLIREFERLKSEESKKLSSGWHLKRELAKHNYKLHTKAVQESIPKDFKNPAYIYADEADMLNRFWRKKF